MKASSQDHRKRARTRTRQPPLGGHLTKLIGPLALIAGFAACLSDETESSLEVARLSGNANSGLAEPPLAPPPPGAIIDTQPNSGWTEGSLSVSHDGSAQYDLPLWVPDGRRGVQPALSLHYDSQAGNGLLGVGWNLSGLSSIAPCPRTLAQDLQTANVSFTGADVYCLDGQRLRGTATAPGAGQREYRTERESFSRIISFGHSNAQVQPTSFKVWTKDGRILTFGGTATSKLLAYRLTGVNAENPSFSTVTPRVTAAWALNRIEDRNGNAITIDYDRVETPSDMYSADFVPTSISYGPDRTVVFGYDEVRPDRLDGFRRGTAGSVHTRLRRRLKTISMSAGSQLLRRYLLDYQTISVTGRSLLWRVTECDGATTPVCMNALSFDWSLGGEAGQIAFEEIDLTSVQDVGTFAESAHRFIVGDINGDGKDDFVYGDEDNEWHMRFSTGTGLTDAQDLGIARPYGPQHRPVIRPIDYDRDGRMDLLAEVPAGSDASKFALYRSTGTSYELYSSTFDDLTLGGDHGQFAAFFADIDGNGTADYVSARKDNLLPGSGMLTWRHRLNQGDSFGTMTESALVTPLPPLDNDDNPDPSHRIRATSLDGRKDQLLIWNYQADKYDAVQLGDAMSLVSGFLNLPFLKLPENADRRSLHFADVNGDGLQDVVYPFSGLATQLNSGTGFSQLIPLPDTTPYLNPEVHFIDGYDRGVRILDFDGDGADDVLILHPEDPSGPEDFQHGAQLYRWRNGAFVRTSLNRWVIGFEPMGAQAIQPLDFDGDGLVDIAHWWANDAGAYLRILRQVGERPDKITRVNVVGLGSALSPRAEIDYSTLADPAIHTPASTGCGYPLTCPKRGRMVVSAHRFANGMTTGSPWHEIRHTYEGARVDLRGRGWLGFEKHTASQLNGSIATVTTFRNSITSSLGASGAYTYPEAHAPSTVTTTVTEADAPEYVNEQLISYQSLAGSTTGTLIVRLGSFVQTDREGETSLHTRAVAIAGYDAFGNPTTTTTFVEGSQRSVVNTYNNDTVSWLIGQLSTTRVADCVLATKECVTRSSSRAYHVNGNLKEVVVEPDAPIDPALFLRTTFEYDDANYGNLTAIHSSDTTGQTCQLDAQCPAETSCVQGLCGRERTRTLTYDARHIYPRTITNDLGQYTTLNIHHDLGVTLDTTDVNRVPTTRKYDGFGRLREVNQADGYFERYTSSTPLIQVTTVATGPGTSLDREYVLRDQLGRPTSHWIRNFAGDISSEVTTYDALGRVASVSRPYVPESGATRYDTNFAYDLRNRLTLRTEPDATTTRYEYQGLETHTYDAKGNHSYVVERRDGRIDSRYEDDPNSDGFLQTRFEYKPFGLVGAIVAADDLRQEMIYDRLGRRTHLDDPSAGGTDTAYDAFGQVVSETDATGATTEFVHDSLGRIRRISSPDGDSIYKWDTAPSGIGKLVNTNSFDGVGINYRYDSLSRPFTTQWNIEGETFELKYDYDAIGRPKSITYPVVVRSPETRLKVDYGYNAAGYLTEVKDARPGFPVYWKAEEMNPAGQLTRERYGNQVVTTYGYQPDTGLLDSIEAIGPGAVGPLIQLGYLYDDNRNVKVRDDSLNGRGDVYEYDELDRLTGWTAGNGITVLAATYTYDDIGNLTDETVVGVPNQSATYAYGQDGAPPRALNARNGIQYGYDAAGRQTSGPNRTVEYNHLGLPKVLTWGIDQGPSKQTTFLYDASNARVIKRDVDQTVVYVGGLFERRNPAGTGSAEIHNLHSIIAEGRTVAQVNWAQAVLGGPITTPRTSYLHTDLQGSTTVVTNSTGERTIADPSAGDPFDPGQLYYDPWGRRIDAGYIPLGENRHGGPRQGYTGHEHEDEYGLVNMRGRIYDPEARRFLTPDPFIQAPLFSQSHNRYAYVWNNPTTFTDPSGFECEECVGEIWSQPPDSTGSGFPVGDAAVIVAVIVGIHVGEAAAGVAASLWSWLRGSGTERSDDDNYTDATATHGAGSRAGSTGSAGNATYGGTAGQFPLWDPLDPVGSVPVTTPQWDPAARAAFQAWSEQNSQRLAAQQQEREQLETNVRITQAVMLSHALSYVGDSYSSGFGPSSMDGMSLAAETAMAQKAIAPRGGSGGNWKAIGERPGGVVGQTNAASCGAACGEMLSGISQARLIELAGAPTSAGQLARSLGSEWNGGYVGPDQFQSLMGRGSWAAHLYETGEKLGHFVVVDGWRGRNLVIRDPAGEGSTYQMSLKEFNRVWTGEAVFK